MGGILYFSEYGAALAAFAAVYFFGLRAQCYGEHTPVHLLARAEYFSRGIFLGIALLHLLPEAYSDLLPSLETHTLYSVLAIALLALLFMLVCEKGIMQIIYRREKNSHHWFAYWILILLCLHAFIEGAALGLSETFNAFLTLAVAILVHKGSEGFALGTVLQKYNFTVKTKKLLILSLALATPLGIFLTTHLEQILNHQHFNDFEGYFNSIAAGTFLYIAICHALSGCDHANHASAHKRWLYYGLGLGLILLVTLIERL